MQKTLWTIIPLTLALVVAGCGDDDEGSKDDSGNEGGEATFVTYNVGLATGFVPYATERRDAVAAAVAASDADVICLQEVWTTDNGDGTWNQNYIDTIVSAAAETFPHAYFERTTSSETIEGACTEEEAAPLGECAEAACSDVPQDQLTVCVVTNCGEEFNALSDSCTNCAAANISKPIAEILDTCTGEGDAFSYEGHNGLLLLSKHPFNSTQHQAMEATLVKRSFLHADVAIPGFGDTDVVCTHLAADLTGLVDYDAERSNFDSYEAEQAAQIDAILAFADSKTSTGSVVIAGDMNTGPEVDGLTAELPANYDKFINAGFDSPYVEWGPECTYCGSNDLNVDDSPDHVIDHIFLKIGGERTIQAADRVYSDEKTEVTDDGAKVEKHISDHFGVSVTVSRP